MAYRGSSAEQRVQLARNRRKCPSAWLSFAVWPLKLCSARFASFQRGCESCSWEALCSLTMPSVGSLRRLSSFCGFHEASLRILLRRGNLLCRSCCSAKCREGEGRLQLIAFRLHRERAEYDFPPASHEPCLQLLRALKVNQDAGYAERLGSCL